MKRKLEITYGNNAKINKGNFEQESPLYSIKSLIDLEDDEEIKEFSVPREMASLKGLVDPLLEAHVSKVKRELSTVRIRVKEGVPFPSVTSVLHPDSPPIDAEYAIRGTEIGNIFQEFIETGKWREPETHLKRLKYEKIKYKAWWEKYKDRIEWTHESKPKELWNEDYKYSGEADIYACLIDKKRTLADIKTGVWGWQQLVAYWFAGGESQEQLAIFDLKKGELKILNTDDLKTHIFFHRFLIKLGRFEARFLN